MSYNFYRIIEKQMKKEMLPYLCFLLRVKAGHYKKNKNAIVLDSNSSLPKIVFLWWLNDVSVLFYLGNIVY